VSVILNVPLSVSGKISANGDDLDDDDGSETSMNIADKATLGVLMNLYFAWRAKSAWSVRPAAVALNDKNGRASLLATAWSRELC
jgi:hypothetical protein